MRIALYNLKGGVGKTTSAVNLAYLAAESGKKTILWDWDPQGAASWYCGVEEDDGKAITLLNKGLEVGRVKRVTPFPNLTVIPADLSLRNEATITKNSVLAEKLINTLSVDADIVIFDCPPTLSASIETILSTVDLVLIPMIPSPLSLRAMRQVADFFEERERKPKKTLGFFNMVDTRRNLHKETLLNARYLPLDMMKTEVPMDSAAEKMSVVRKPLASYSKSGRASQAYRSMWREMRSLTNDIDVE